ncbi:MAG TPA: 2-succinyl-5-enolpyruvyl-6-hydroxy-3-cyclohexene-1-carboxylic-acid synthase [Solirubrobacteraceae bacterium]|nr:2-succinyl-5-enolpyruvyl-6-hydroxy-3-cyclohexene-1-carboxylic-acid synthase [Solirubrobacteraceae bacterium]
MATATDSHMLLRALCDEFGRCGMEHACTSPGSRNSPIVAALVREPRIRCWSHIDERCAGFFAIGAAKASGRPVAVTCTSGTAAANLLPAVIEAREGRVPLVLLTADRPAELRDVGAGQAIDQLKLYGDAVKWFCEVEPPDASPASVRWMRQLACRAYWTALQGRPGPVHLNLPLREPLVPDGPLPEDPLPGRANGDPWVTRAVPDGGWTTGRRTAPARGVIVAGQLRRDAPETTAVARLSQRAGWPLLADPLSGLRHACNAVGTYDLMLRDPAFGDRMRPELVVRVGDLPTSKPLRAWLERLADVPQLAVDPESTWHDPAAVVSRIDAGEPGPALSGLVPAELDHGWLAAWLAADDAVGATLAEGIGEEPSEPLVARRLGEWLDPGATLFCASSMPIRDLELYLPARVPLPRVLSNRGANGIDGTVSSAFGVAAAGEGPVVLLIGDVALAHDVGGLIAARRLGLELTIVVLNNDGGGIFHFLPISAQSDVFEEHVATPHGLDLMRAAALYDLRYARPRSAAGLRDAVVGSLGSGETTMIEVRTDRADNLALHGRLADAGLWALRRLAD